MAAVVVFVTTYALVLPAITLDKDTAQQQPGIEVAASEANVEKSGTAVAEAEPEEEPAEEDSAEYEEIVDEQQSNGGLEEPENDGEDAELAGGSGDVVSVDNGSVAEPGDIEDVNPDDNGDAEPAENNGVEPEDSGEGEILPDERFNEDNGHAGENSTTTDDAAVNGAAPDDAAVNGTTETLAGDILDKEILSVQDLEAAIAAGEIRLITGKTQLVYEYIDEEYEKYKEEHKAEIGNREENKDKEAGEYCDEEVDDGYFVYAEFDASAKLPEGVELQVREIAKESNPEEYAMYCEKTLAEMQNQYDENTGITFARFYDISFVYQGLEIEPSGDVKIRIEYKREIDVRQDENIDAIHFNKGDEENPEVIKSEINPDEKENSRKKDDEENDPVKAVEFTSDQFSVYGVVGTGSITTTFLSADGNTYEVTINCNTDANIPAGSELVVSEVEATNDKYEEYLANAAEAMDVSADKIAYAKLLDISIAKDGEEVTPEKPVDVQIKLLDRESIEEKESLNVFHYETGKEKPVLVDGSEQNGVVSFEATGFSVYGVFYTVDFHWEADGKEFEFSIPGGGVITLKNLIKVLSVISDDEQADIDRFIADIEDVEFSNPELVWTGKAAEDSTAGALKDEFGLMCEYSAELSEEEIAEINDTAVSAGEWVLISLKSFESEETLSVFMKNGDSFVVNVTDANVPSSQLSTEKHYVLYGIYEGQYYALKSDGSCYQVPNNDLDAIYDNEDFQWYYTGGSSPQWRAPVEYNNYNYINLWFERRTSATWTNWGSNIYLDPDPNGSGGYYFRTDSWDGNTYTLWLYYDFGTRRWSFVSGAGEGNGSVTYIYEKGQPHKYTVGVNNAEYGKVYINDTAPWVTSGESSITNSGFNATQIWAGADDGYWFDHWELDGQTVAESDSIVTYEEGGRSYSWIAQGGLSIGNEDGHTLTAVFVPETRFAIEASPEGTGSVNISTSARTKSGYNKEEITATAEDGFWFGHWEIDGVEVPGESYTITEDGSGSTLAPGSLLIGDGNTLTAVFIPETTYTVTVTGENGSAVTGCTVQVGSGTPGTTIENNDLKRTGVNADAITATAGPGYVFKGWLLDDEPILGSAVSSAADGSTSTINAEALQIGIEGSHTIKAVFAQEYTFTVGTYPSGGGTVKDDSKPAGATIYASLTSDGHNKYAITATANSGYAFSYWTLNGQPIVDDHGAYLYTDGTIPERVLTLTSSDNVQAVFVNGVYTIHAATISAGGSGSVNRENTLTVSNSSVNKQASQTITATANYGSRFAYWRVEDPTTVVDWGQGYSAASSTIKPTVTQNTTVTAMFVQGNARLYTVTVDDPSHGTVYGQKDLGRVDSASKAIPTSIYGATTFVGKANSDNKNDGQIEVRTVAPGYKFLGWNVYYPDGRLYQGYTNTAALQNSRINSAAVSIPQDGMVIKAMFTEVSTPPAFQDDSMADLTNWAEGIAGTDYDTDKTAEVFDYDNRIYRIEMSASSRKQAIDTSVVLNFITDTSRSMYFPANLTPVKDVSGYTQDGSAFGQRINRWLTSTNQNKSNVYYAITAQNGNATVHAIYYSTANSRWESVDASYYGPNAADGQTRSGSALTSLNIGDNPNNYMVYQAPPREANKPWSRLDYLVMSVETAVKTIYTICPNAQIDLTTFNRSASYRGTLPNDEAAIENILRNIDVAGGTRQDLGLQEARGHFTEGSSKRQIAVLITDGTPNSGLTDVSESTIRSNANNLAPQLKAIKDADGNNLELYTMGLSVKNVGTNESWLSGLASTPSSTYFKSVETGAETEEAIKQIVNSLLTKVSLFGTMTDTVDPAFYPVDIDGNPIAAGIYAMDGSALSAAPTNNIPYYVWENDGGNWTITWHNQTFAWADGSAPGWKKDFYVKAKEDFLGGNRLSTNAGSSNGMTASGYVKADTSVTPLNSLVTKTFDYTPCVNVDELHMEGNRTEWTVYLGTEVDPAAQLIRLLNEIPVKQVVKPGGTDDGGICITGAGQMYYPHNSGAVDNEDEPAPGRDTSQTLPLSYYISFTDGNIEEILRAKLDELADSTDQEKTIAVDGIEYTEYGHNAGKFTLTITKNVNAEAAEDGAPDPHETRLAGTAVETYTLNVEYTPYSNNAASTYSHTVSGGSAGRITDGTGANQVISENAHIINVIEKGLEVIKLDSVTNEKVTDRPAEFRLYRALKAGESSGNTLTTDNAAVAVIEVSDLITGGNEGANRMPRLPWYKSASGNHDGQYFLREETPPDGYVGLQKPVVITITRTDSYKNLKGESISDIAGVPYNNTQTAAVTITLNGETVDAEEINNIFEIPVPNTPTGSLAIRKQVQTINDAPLTDMDGVYMFSASGPVGSDEPYTYYVVYRVENGVMTTYRYEKYAGENAGRAAANIIDSSEGPVEDQDTGYVIRDMETGIYALKEYRWTLDDNSIDPDDIYLKDILLNPATGGNTNDVIAMTTSVLVTADDPGSAVLTVTFINEYGPNRCSFGAKKIWKDESGSLLTEPWDGMISTIEFSVTQTANAGTEDEIERQLTFNGSPNLVIHRYGQRALAAPTEAGSAEYTVQMSNGGDAWQTFISGLEKTAPDDSPYSYKIEEICVRDMRGNVVTGYETTYDLSEDGGELIEEGGQYAGIQSINDGATASIINRQVDTAGLNLKKVLDVSAEAPLNGDLTRANGFYTFTVTGPEGAESPVTKYVKIIASSTKDSTEGDTGYTTSYTYQTGDTVAERDAMPPAPVVNGGVPIDSLTPGRYTITEEGWTFDTPQDGSIMYLKEIDISGGSGNTSDISTKTAEVYVGEGEIGSLSVAFTNYMKPYPGIRLIKIDETTRPVDKTTRYLPNAEFQILKWSGTNYQVYPNAADSKVTTDEDGAATFPGVEPGEYMIVETITPAGYVKQTSNDIYIKVDYNSSTGLHTITRYSEAYTGDDSVNRTVVSESENLLAVTYEQASDTDLAAFTVGNTPGVALPSTGGPGTRLFTILGSILILGAGVLLWRRRRLI